MPRIDANCRPRLKPIYPLYRLDDDTIRVGAQRQLTLEFRDPRGHVWELLRLADGSRDVVSLIQDMRCRFPELSDDAVMDGLERLDRVALLDDARFDTRGPGLSRYEGNVNHFLHFVNLSDDPWAPHRTLQGKKVALLGLGGGGSVILPLLAASGIGCITAVDYDRVEKSNLNRQWLYGEADIGRLKTSVAERIVSAINSETELHTVNRR